MTLRDLISVSYESRVCFHLFISQHSNTYRIDDKNLDSGNRFFFQNVLNFSFSCLATELPDCRVKVNRKCQCHSDLTIHNIGT